MNPLGTVLLALFFILLLAQARPAQTLPVGCSVVGGEALCTGNQSAGIVSSNEGLSRLTVRERTAVSSIRPANAGTEEAIPPSSFRPTDRRSPLRAVRIEVCDFWRGTRAKKT